MKRACQIGNSFVRTIDRLYILGEIVGAYAEKNNVTGDMHDH